MTHAPQFKLGDPNTPAHSLPAAAVKRLLDAEESGLTIEYWFDETGQWIPDEDFDPFEFDTLAYRIKPNGPTLWRDMTDEEKSALLLAHHEGKVIENNADGTFFAAPPVWDDDVAYRIKPDDTPTLWRDMTDEEKGALLLAHREGASIHVWEPIAGVWRAARWEPLFQADRAYRVGPAATREPIKIQGPSGEILGSGTMLRRDGEWDFDSIEVEDQ